MARCGALRVLLVAAAAAVAAVAAAASVSAGDAGRGRVARERRVWRVVAEHTNAINKCDLRRLMAQHPPSVVFLFPNGDEARGRRALAAVYKDLCGARGGRSLVPFRFTPQSAHRLGSTVFMRWEFTSPALAKPYGGSSAFGTVGDKLVREVSTFDTADLVFKRDRQ